MKNFPLKFKPENKESFAQYRYDRNLCYLRKEIYEEIIKGNDWVDLTLFDKKYVEDMETTLKLTEQLVSELKNLGWKITYLYGKTAIGFGEKYDNQEDI